MIWIHSLIIDLIVLYKINPIELTPILFLNIDLNINCFYLKEECDRQAEKIFREFKKRRGIQDKVSSSFMINNNKYKYKYVLGGPPGF